MPAYTQPCPSRRCGVDFHDPTSPAGISCRQATQAQRAGGSFDVATSAFNPMADGPTMRAEDISVYGPNIARYTWVDDEEDAPGPGDAVSLSSYQGMTPALMHRDGVEYLGLRQTSWGDQVGDAVARSNHRSLLRDFPNTFVQMESMDSNELVLRSDQKIPQALGEILNGLQEYSIYDEDDLGALEQDLFEESWDAYAGADLKSSLGNASWVDGEVDVDAFNDLKLRRVFEEVVHERTENGHEPFRSEGADNVVFSDWEEMADEVRSKIEERGMDSMNNWDVSQGVHVVTDPEAGTGFSFTAHQEMPDGSYGQLTRDFFAVQNDSGSWDVHEQRTYRTFDSAQRLADGDSTFTDTSDRVTASSGIADREEAERAANMAAIKGQMFGEEDVTWNGYAFSEEARPKFRSDR